MYSRLYLWQISKSLSVALIMVLTFFVGEIIYSFLLSILQFEFYTILNNFLGNVISNIIVGLICFVYTKNQRIKEFLNTVLLKLNKNGHKILFISVIILICILTYKNAYYNFDVNYAINFLLIISFLVLFTLYFNDRKNKEKLSSEQEVLYNCIIKYEKELTNKNKIIHDFKNQLQAISGFVSEKDTKLKKYLAELLNDINKFDKSYIKELNKIPLGGLKGLFCCKFMDIQDSNINLNLYIDKAISCIEDLDIELYKNIVKILGVYIDNAIEAVINSKEKILEVEMFKEKNKVFFIITNSYSGKINLERLGNIGYTSKGINRGYGLAYVKDILEKETRLRENVKLINDKYSVTLEVDI
jgi:two-component system sensor histidine kinase AgrC